MRGTREPISMRSLSSGNLQRKPASKVGVVPAKAGTHNHRAPWFSTVVTHDPAAAYGSPPSRGRHRRRTIRSFGRRLRGFLQHRLWSGVELRQDVVDAFGI